MCSDTVIRQHSKTGTLDKRTYQRDIIVPTILPDELIHGYLGRIRTVNALFRGGSHAALLEKIFLNAGELGGKARLTQATAKMTELTLTKLCQKHTLMPYLRATTTTNPELVHGAPENLVLIEKSSFRLAIKLRMACPECVREDKNYWGFAYWRRRHQLPGVPWCDKHRARLMPIDGDFDVCPSISAISIDEHYGTSTFEECIRNPVVSRYVDIVSGFLESQQPLSCGDAARKLSLRAQHLSIRVSEKGRRPVLSDVALNAVPKAWLSSLFSGIETKTPGERFGPIDRVLLHEGLPQARALALALMFDSAKQALNYWEQPLVEDSRYDAKNTICGQDFWNSNKVFNIYVKSEGNRSEIARLIGVHSRRASGELDRCGLPSLSNIQLNATGKALLAFYEGRPLSEACAIHGAETTICENLIRQGGARFAEALRRILGRQCRANNNLKKATIKRPRTPKHATQTQKGPVASENCISEVAVS